MHCVIASKHLSELIKAVEPACAKRTTKLILVNVLFTADAEGLTANATNLETAIVSSVHAIDLKTAGRVVVDQAKLRQIADASDGDITLKLDGDTLHVTTANGRFKLNTWPVDDFPSTGIPNAYVDVPGLCDAFRKIAFAADRKESGARWAVTGVLMEVANQCLTIAATDTKRLAVMPCGTLPTDGRYLIPRVVADTVAKSGGTVGVNLDKSSAAFKLSDGTIIVTRLVEGKFPPHNDIIPKKFDHKIELPLEQFTNAIRQAAIMTDDETKRVQFEFAPGGVTLSATGSGESEVRIDMPDCDAEITIAFDPAYLLEGLKTIDGESTVTLQMNNGDKLAIFSSGDWRYLVMPLCG